MSRAEFARALAVATRADPLPLEECPFPDAATHWAATEGYLQAILRAGIIAPGDYPGGLFAPDSTVTRLEMCRMVVRALGLGSQTTALDAGLLYVDVAALPDRDCIAQATDLGLFRGFADRTFRPGHEATRAEAAVALQRLLAARAGRGPSGELSSYLVVGGQPLDQTWDLVETLDGGYFAVGVSRYISDRKVYPGPPWMSRYDGSGRLVWTKRYPEDIACLGSVTVTGPTPEGCFNVVYPLEPLLDGGRVWRTIATDDSGNDLWSADYGVAGGPVYRYAWPPEDGGWLLFGSPADEGAPLTRVDARGAVSWSRVSSPSWSNEPMRVVASTADGGVIVAGWSTGTEGPSGFRPWLARLDAEGKEVWFRYVPSAVGTVPGWVSETPAGDFVVVLEDFEGWSLLRTDSAGHERWFRPFATPPSSEATGVSVTYRLGDAVLLPGDALVVVGYIRGATDHSMVLMKLDARGAVVWSETYDAVPSPNPRAIIRILGGGFLIAGGCEGGYFLLRLDDEGHLKSDQAVETPK